MSDQKLPLKRHFISLETKIKILDRLQNGEKVTCIARNLNLNEATIRTIQKSEQKIRASVVSGCSISSNMVSRPRAPIIEKMEKALNIWIDDCSKKRIQLDTNIIIQKSVRIYNYLKENGESAVNPDFVGSKGWFDRFKKRFSLQNLKVQGESASADKETAKVYPLELQNIIELGGYSRHQVFNADETGHWWKKMPKRTFISRDEKVAPGFKVSKDRVTLLMCSNASGDYMMKPMLVYKSINPRVMKHVCKSKLPIYWTANRKAWVTTETFKMWFFKCFVPSVEKYLKQKNQDFKVLLILDNAPSHPKDLYHSNVKIIFLPPNTTALLQPLDQGIIATFKAIYIRKSLEWILNKIESEDIGVVKAWKLFTILDCITLIDSSMKEIKPTTLCSCWKKIWPDSIQSVNPIQSSQIIIESIVELAKSLGGEGFDDITGEEFEELLVEEEINEAHLIQMISDIHDDNSLDDSTDENEEIKEFTLKSVKKGLDLFEQGIEYFINEDADSERSSKFKREINKCLAPYYEIYKDLSAKIKQPKITNFFQMIEPQSQVSVDANQEDHDMKAKRRRFMALSRDDLQKNM